jgi:hypothetical protein
VLKLIGKREKELIVEKQGEGDAAGSSCAVNYTDKQTL